MRCALCDSDQARIRVTRNAGGQSQALELCEPCAQQWGGGDRPMDESRLDDLFEAGAAAEGARKKEAEALEGDSKTRRFAMVIGLREEKVEEYRQLHAAVWPDVLETIRACNMRNFSIYLRKFDDGQNYLFAYYEYIGTSHEADQKRMAADPATQRWWALTEPCQKPAANRRAGEWWASLEEVFHCD